MTSRLIARWRLPPIDPSPVFDVLGPLPVDGGYTVCWKTASKNGCQKAAVVGAAAPVDLTGHGQHLTVLALPGRGMVQWLRVSYKATAALCTGHVVPVKELQVGLPGNGGVRTIPVSALPAVARTYCPEAPPAVIETPEASLTGP